MASPGDGRRAVPLLKPTECHLTYIIRSCSKCDMHAWSRKNRHKQNNQHSLSVHAGSTSGRGALCPRSPPRLYPWTMRTHLMQTHFTCITKVLKMPLTRPTAHYSQFIFIFPQKKLDVQKNDTFKICEANRCKWRQAVNAKSEITMEWQLYW